MSDVLSRFSAFDVSASTVTVWAFKTSQSSNESVVFTGRWIETTDGLDEALKQTINDMRMTITEVHEYGLLAQTNEGSALTISAMETHAGLLIDQSNDPSSKKKVRKLKDINNSEFYVVKLTYGSPQLYCIKKTNSSWKTKTAKGLLAVVYSDNVLDLDQGAYFSISKYFDFFIVGVDVLILNKSSFESTLRYKEAHIDDFESLKNEPLFQSIFSDVKHLLEYVGTNKIQLRRMSAVRQKAYYKSSDFMNRLKTHCKTLGFAIEFDELGRIVPSPKSCRDIVQALLDHRLNSMLTDNLYDVENTYLVGKPA